MKKKNDIEIIDEMIKRIFRNSSITSYELDSWNNIKKENSDETFKKLDIRCLKCGTRLSKQEIKDKKCWNCGRYLNTEV